MVRRRKIIRQDFEKAMSNFGIDRRAFDNIFKRFKKALPKWHDFVDVSFLPTEMKKAYHNMLNKKVEQIKL